MLPLLILRIRIRRLTATVKSNAFVAKGSISVVTLSILYKDLVLVLVIFLQQVMILLNQKRLAINKTRKMSSVLYFLVPLLATSSTPST
jgi:hypothetical protein